MRSILATTVVAASLFACLASCARHAGVAGESVVLDERLSLVRGKSLDTVTRS
jgi:hypothetical protein